MSERKKLKIMETQECQARSWTEDEIRQSVPGYGLNSEVAEHEMMNARVVNGDYRRSEQIELVQGKTIDALQSLRTSLARGNIPRAKAQILRFERNRQAGLVPSEIALERARLHAIEGEWPEAVSSATLGLDCEDVPSISRLSLLQVRANAFYEMNEISKSSRDLQDAEALADLYTDAPVSFYIEILRLKAGLHHLPAPVTAAQLSSLLNRRFGASVPNADQLLTLLRFRIEMNRFAGLPTARLAAASMYLAAAMGDRLYEALALVDLSFSECAAARGFAIHQLRSRQQEFKRVRCLMENERLRDYSQRVVQTARFSEKDLAVTPQVILFADLGCRLKLADCEAARLTLQDRVKSILREFEIHPKISKTDLFLSIWKLRFDPDRHDITLRTALRRVRAQTQVKIHSRLGVIELSDVLIISLKP